ncbi:hypothetical protein [Thermoflavimicrobium dichotomicum]|uniref:Uncharacterized protein n=1 Tax=Thermoflavimicrobium dichotomicum TaxID=46223 RepID=A0A1I3NDH4_9BACL|nr:hypothetical protein [Thermoflavimicrobium dichotomicum]SFJ07127.1 hypothetical protein SAMN05421852_10493 [Thermoflavimicrobium dichotomicum]
MQETERGIALPTVLAISFLLFVLFTAMIGQIVRSQQAHRLYVEAVRAQYAAESGIAWRQLRLSKKNNDIHMEEREIDRIRVLTQVKRVNQLNQWQISATAFARYGVSQTITVYLDENTLEILRWVR